MKHIVAVLGALALVAAPSDAKPGGDNSGGKGKGHGNSHSQKSDKGKGPDHAGNKSDKGDKGDKDFRQFARFQDNERNEIVDYFGRFRTQGDGLPPGLAMNQRRGKPLPPGWQKKLVPGYRIGDSEWQSFAPVPSSWFPNQRMESGTRLYHYGDRVVRVYEPRREVVDVIYLTTGR